VLEDDVHNLMPQATKPEEYVLGFSARLDPELAGAVMVPESLRMARMPISLDTSIWEDVLSSSQHTPQWRGANGNLWSNLEDLIRSARAETKARSCSAWVVGVTVVNDDGWQKYSELKKESGSVRALLALHNVGALYLDEAEPRTLPQSARLLGYDVADTFQYSAVTNMGLTAAVTSPYVISQLNEHLLFDTPEAPATFREYADEHVGPHAPFLVYGLYFISQIEREQS
jgi:hypothetical protein